MLQREKKNCLCCQLFMLLRSHATAGVIRETENSRDDRWEASGRHKTGKYVLIRTFHSVRPDFIVYAVSVNALEMGVQLLYHQRLNTLPVESDIDFIYQRKPIGAFWIVHTVHATIGAKEGGKREFLQSLLPLLCHC